LWCYSPINFTTMQNVTIRFYYETESGHECLMECAKRPDGWEPTRVEPEPPGWFTIQELDAISAMAAGLYRDVAHLGYARLGRYFSDEAELAARQLEDARESWGRIQTELDRIKHLERQAELRVRSIESEIKEKFKN
jgi:hypothetical protein